MGTNGSPTAPHGLVLRQHEAAGSRIHSIMVLGLFDGIFYKLCPNMIPRGLKIKKLCVNWYNDFCFTQSRISTIPGNLRLLSHLRGR